MKKLFIEYLPAIQSEFNKNKKAGFGKFIFRGVKNIDDFRLKRYNSLTVFKTNSK
jgi:hypothetical protein